MRAAILQFAPQYGEPEENLDRVDRLLSGVEADLIVLPELFTSGYFFRSTEEARQMAEPIPGGRTTRRLEEWAARHEAVLAAGLAEREGDTLYNSAVVAGPGGYVGRYRKTHLYYEEKTHFATGADGFPVFEVEAGGTTYGLGVMICFDWYFPESARTLALSGADVIVHPSNLVRKNCPRAMPIRALENHCFTLTANRIGEETNGGETLTFIGQSLICDPAGETLAQAGREEETILTAEFDPHVARDRRITAHNDIFADRQPDRYVSEPVR